MYDNANDLRNTALLSGFIYSIIYQGKPCHLICNGNLLGLIKNAYASFSVPEVAPVARLKNDVTILELFHGKTWSFKDVAMSCVGQFYDYFCSKRKQHYTIVVGTGGDTGSAAIDAVRGLEWVDIVVLLPRGRCAKIQELQMTTVLEDNVHVFRADGSSDDIDLAIKPLFMDAEFRTRHRLTSINSINWCRIMVQIVHYFYAYFKMSSDVDSPVEIVVPTGACGNLTAGCIASKMGLPVRLVCAVTCNDIVSRALSSGDFSLAQTVTPTLAPAMDIQLPYNMERIWYIFTGGDTALINKLMLEFESTGSVQVPEALANKISAVITDAHVVSDDTVTSTMARVWADNSYLVCPHTAIGVAYSHENRSKDESIPRICIATASPAKFKEAVDAAGIPWKQDERVTRLMSLPVRYEDMERNEDWSDILRKKIIAINTPLC
ncbi:threonine synthase-like 2 isoform X4 [Dreissena polymorpha]|uniref:threonine synthase-like 2 isoform X4 n=1 Tax=Dreissena polymorpha TaxID=45954 RepID=UPI0022653862|nr:threonine synthase-like 2 isoform X4 [Dreissena polymorpha]